MDLKSKQISEFKETEIGKIPTEWNIRKLEDILSGKLRHGIYKSKEYLDSKGVRILKMGLLDESDRIDHQNMERVLVSDSEIERFRICEGSVIFARTSMMTGGLGNCGIVLKHNDPIIFDGNLLCAEINTQLADPTYIFYYFKSKYGQNEIVRITGGTQSRNIAGSQLVNASVILPSKSEQIKLSKILFDFDSKIENIKNQNIILDQMAQAIFKSWFVDFDGVTEFEDSELGKIPKEWEVSNIGGKLEVILGGTPSRNNGSYWENGNIPWINSGKTNEFRIISPSELITEEGLKKSATRLIPKRTTVLAITGATLGQVSLLEIDSCANQSVIAIKGNDEIPSEYIYYYVKNAIKNIISSQTGGAQQHINRQNVYDANLLVPKKEVIKKYFKISKPILDIISDNCFQIQLLTKTRDILLPKLMSGEIRV